MNELKYTLLALLFLILATADTIAAFSFGPWLYVLGTPVWFAAGWCAKRASFG